MKWPVVALLGCSILSPLAAGADAKAISLCDLLAHPDEHMGERVSVYGAIVSYEHGIYLVSNSECAGQRSGITVQGNIIVGSKGVKRLASVEGELVMSNKVGVAYRKTGLSALSVARTQTVKNR